MRPNLPVAALLLFTACSTPTEPRDHLVVHISVSSTVVAPDRPITIRMTVTNGDATRDVGVPNPGGCGSWYRVLNETNTVVGPGGGRCILLGWAPLMLKPRQSLTMNFQYAGQSVWREDGTWEYLAPGTYHITSTFSGAKMSVSDPVAIRVE